MNHIKIIILICISFFYSENLYAQNDIKLQSLVSDLYHKKSVEHHIFKGIVYDSSKSYDYNLYIISSCFEKEVRLFRNHYFRKYAFPSDTFKRKINIEENTFDSSTSIVGSFFVDSAIFHDNTYKIGAQFDSTTFKNFVSFNLSHLHGPIRFIATKFDGFTDFSDIQQDISTKLNFSFCQLPEILDFSYNNFIGNEVDFTTANLLPDRLCYINLYNTDISKIKIDYSHFRLYFRDRYANDTLSDAKTRIIYENLLKCFIDKGQKEDAEILDVAYHNYLLPFKWWYWIPKIWYKFGYCKFWIFGWTLLFILLFSFFTYRSIDRLANEVYTIKNIPSLYPLKRYGRIRIFKIETCNYFIWRRWWYTLVYTISIFFLFSLHIDDLKFGNKSGVAYVIFVYAIGLICIAYMANFVLQK